MEVECRLMLDRETKSTVRYSDNDVEHGGEKLGTIYIPKTLLDHISNHASKYPDELVVKISAS